MKIPCPLLFPILCGVTTLYNPQSLQAQSQMSANDLYRLASPSVLLIETYGEDGKVSGNGTGFLVGEKGEILTNYHVIAHTKRATVRLANDDAYDTVEVLDIDKRKDIALLKIKEVGIPHLRLGHSATVQVGDKLYALGNPLGVFQNSLSDGILSGIRQMDGYKLFQLSTPISHGSSGSPVLNSSGEVVGIIESTVDAGQNLNFAIPIDYAIGLLDSRTPRSLVSTFESEEKSDKEKTDVKPVQASQPAPLGTPSQGIQQDAFAYISNKMTIWTKEDAELELGPMLDRRDAVFNNSVAGDIYKYKSPAVGFQFIELSISRQSHKLTAAYFYYGEPVSWASIRDKLGKNYKKQKMPNGRPGYLYQFQNRQVFVIEDSAHNVYNIGVW